jgi:hypothetical protein
MNSSGDSSVSLKDWGYPEYLTDSEKAVLVSGVSLNSALMI